MERAFARFVEIVGRVWSQPVIQPRTEANAFRDPLSHPDLARMSRRELADLQFRPECVRSQ